MIQDEFDRLRVNLKTEIDSLKEDQNATNEEMGDFINSLDKRLEKLFYQLDDLKTDFQKNSKEGAVQNQTIWNKEFKRQKWVSILSAYLVEFFFLFNSSTRIFI